MRLRGAWPAAAHLDKLHLEVTSNEEVAALQGLTAIDVSDFSLTESALNTERPGFKVELGEQSAARCAEARAPETAAQSAGTLRSVLCAWRLPLRRLTCGSRRRRLGRISAI